MNKSSSPIQSAETAKTSTTRLLVVEDHELARTGLCLTLEGYGGFTIVAQAADGKEALAALEQQSVDVVLMDIGMPVMNGIQATQLIKQQYPATKVIMLTSHHDEEEVFAALAAGAEAYCMKNIAMDRLAQVIEMVKDGAIWMDPLIAKLVLGALPTGRQAPTPSVQTSDQTSSKRVAYNAALTDRELEVLQHLVTGKTNKEIAQAMVITPHTVKAHVSNIIQKLAVDDRTQAAVKAIQAGLVH